MITRYAFFDGTVHAGQEQAFQQAVMETLLPLWKQFPAALAVRVGFALERDEGAPAYPLVLAIDYPDQKAVAAALESPIRAISRKATQDILATYFTGHVHHHVMSAHNIQF